MRAQLARYDASQQHRRVMIGKVKVASKELAMHDDDYRALLLRVTSRASAADCTVDELARVLDEMRRLGFRPKPRNGRAPVATHPSAAKARALWISLYQLGAIDDRSERALEAFAKRQLKVERLAWADQRLTYKLIEALKAMAERHGWDQSVATTAAPDAALRILQVRLCEAILAKLQAADMVPADMTLRAAAERVAGMDDDSGLGPTRWSIDALRMLAQRLGDRLRDPLNPITAMEMQS